MAKKSAIEELGISTAAAAGSGVLGGLVNQLFAGSNDRRQIRQQQKLTDTTTDTILYSKFYAGRISNRVLI